MVGFRKKEAKTPPPVFISGIEVEQVNSFLGSMELPSQRIYFGLHTSPPWLKKHKKGCSSFYRYFGKISVNF